MDYKKILKGRMYRGAVILALGVLCFILEYIKPADTGVLLFWAVAMCGYGIIRILQCLWKSRNDEVLYKNSIEETDERNRMIWGYARCRAMDIYLSVCIVAIIVFEYLEWYDRAQVLGYSMCVLTAIYAITYYVMKRIY